MPGAAAVLIAAAAVTSAAAPIVVLGHRESAPVAPVERTLTITATYGDGSRAVATRRVPLAPGWG